MYVCRFQFTCTTAIVVATLCGTPTSTMAQSAQSAPTQSVDAHAGHDVASMAREGSGTSWLPDSSPIYAFHAQKGPWMLMAHENAFLQYLHESGSRGASQLGSINWVMGMAARNVGDGRLQFRMMLSFEPWTIPGCGYPNLLASGEECRGEPIHDRQHPHDLFSEISAEYDKPLGRATRLQIYGGPVGEPALGPVSYLHRISAMPNPLAPIGHHWLDSTHVSFGVVTAGVYGRRWKVEGSAFNGREPDERRTDFDFGPLDAVSGRVWFLPNANFAFQVSAGHLPDAEAADGDPRLDVTKATASGTYTRAVGSSVWATTVAWGRNAETEQATNALLGETNFTINERHTWFGRFEVAGKTPHDLDVSSASSAITVAKVQAGYTRYLSSWHGLAPGLGTVFSAGIVPRELESAYGRRVNLGIGVFATVRPSRLVIGAAPGASTGRTMVMVQTAFDPTKLSCSPPIDAAGAPTATYQGKTYYFCSERERDEFLTDPAMSLQMMPPKQ